MSFKNLELRSPHFCEKIGDNFGESIIKNRWVTHIYQSQDYVFSTISSQDLISPIYFLRAQSLSCCYCLNSIVIIFKKVFLVFLTDWMQLFFWQILVVENPEWSAFRIFRDWTGMGKNGNQFAGYINLKQISRNLY